MQIDNVTVYSFPMKPSVFYGVKEMKLKHKALEHPLTVNIEIIAKDTGSKPVVYERVGSPPDFLIKTQNLGGVYGVAVKSIERILRNEIFSAPAGGQISGCRKDIADIASMFRAVPVIEGDVVARIPIVVAREVYFKTPYGNEEKVGRSIFVMKPYNFGFIVTERRELEEMLGTIERKINSAFQVV